MGALMLGFLLSFLYDHAGLEEGRPTGEKNYGKLHKIRAEPLQ